MDEGLVRFRLAGGEAAELREQSRSDANSDELFGVSRGGAVDPAGVAQFGVR